MPNVCEKSKNSRKYFCNISNYKNNNNNNNSDCLISKNNMCQKYFNEEVISIFNKMNDTLVLYVKVDCGINIDEVYLKQEKIYLIDNNNYLSKPGLNLMKISFNYSNTVDLDEFEIYIVSDVYNQRYKKLYPPINILERKLLSFYY